MAAIVGLSGSAFASVGNYPSQQPAPRTPSAHDNPSVVNVGNRPQIDAARAPAKKVAKNATDAVQQR
ncbi:MAG: hypothetical protein B6A08_17990 [Sorangiineae bacterium NIC37A_2]|nr:MAG: hypothetical protein B6A08_17990 [Sorangiineae bacterium NIC37A_2]